MFHDKNKKKEAFLEVCVDSVASALAAKKGGADRLELCSNLIIGGTTPGLSLFQLVKKACQLPVHVLIRPRFGDFCYDSHELAMMLKDIKLFREAGADGVVIGILKPDGHLNKEEMSLLIKEAGDMSVTLHRAFDVCLDPLEALEDAIDMGIDTILTSGQETSALKGKELLMKLKEQAGNRITLMAGSGIQAANIKEVQNGTGLTTFHMSGKKNKESSMQYRKENVPMGFPLVSEYVIFETDADEIAAAKKALLCHI